VIYPIVRLYDSVQRANSAVERLRVEGFSSDAIDLISAPVGGVATGSGDDSIVNAIAASYVLKWRAKIYAERVRRGGALVIVRAEFGAGRLATDTLDRFGPIDSGLPLVEDPAPRWDEGAPLSSLLQMPVITKAPTPFSSFLALPLLTRRSWTLGSALGLPAMTRRGWTLSGAFGMPTLSKRSTPFSSMLGLPLLTGGRRRPAGG